jgi:hypothetical protein
VTRFSSHRFSIAINAKKLGYGAHRVKASVTMQSVACALVALSGRFIHAKAAAIRPSFPG